MPRILSRSDFGPREISLESSLTSNRSVGFTLPSNRRKRHSVVKPFSPHSKLKKSHSCMEETTEEKWGFFVTGSASAVDLPELGSTIYTSPSRTADAYPSSLVPIIENKSVQFDLFLMFMPF
uniref:Uncharacterized protein n=1 Tax=Ditylum brightwellii TaxID=49249 RepID=A0A7S4ST15_9STRA|mmetsp:Transcript_29371/g.44387  ORF Transcript_29371/g.44387 Transcript_29371/m.44387 type:complete len:122 (-) Transcript_29371:288-653(-)